MSALVVGSMAPDFPYFTKWPSDQYGHSLIGVFAYCIPAGFIVLSVFHLVIKRPTLELLPDSHRNRLAPLAKTPAMSGRLALTALAALILGAATHVAWDSFTHAYGASVARLPFLQYYLFHAPILGDVHVYKVLQHGSTFVGLGLLAYGYARWYRRANPEPSAALLPIAPDVRRRWVVGAILTAVAASAVFALLRIQPAGTSGRWQALAKNLVVPSMALIALELLAFSAYWHWSVSRNPRKAI